MAPPEHSDLGWVAPRAWALLAGTATLLAGAIGFSGVAAIVVCSAGGVFIAYFFAGYAWDAMRSGIPEHDRRDDAGGTWSGSGETGWL